MKEQGYSFKNTSPSATRYFAFPLIIFLLSLTSANAEGGYGKILSPDSTVKGGEFQVEIDLRPVGGMVYFLADLYGELGWWVQPEARILPRNGTQKLWIKLGDDSKEDTLPKGQVFYLVLIGADKNCKERIDKQLSDHENRKGGGRPIKGFEDGCNLLDSVALKNTG